MTATVPNLGRIGGVSPTGESIGNYHLPRIDSLDRVETVSGFIRIPESTVKALEDTARVQRRPKPVIPRTLLILGKVEMYGSRMSDPGSHGQAYVCVSSPPLDEGSRNHASLLRFGYANWLKGKVELFDRRRPYNLGKLMKRLEAA